MAPRRGHRKSRHGCVECKRRHVKCDETHPICFNCVNTRRSCSFQALTPSTMGGPSPGPSFTSAGPSPGATNLLLDVPNVHSVPSAHMDQLHLMHHFLSGAIPVHDKMPTHQHLVEQALGLPYLMNEILAYSARHLASTCPDKAPQYIFLAREYQAHALTFFNTTQAETTADNAMQMLVFSWMVGMNLLCDAACADDDATVLDDFIRYIELYRGVRVIASAAWDVLIKSNHASVFEDGQLISMKLGTGAETEALQVLITDSLGMDDEQKQGNQEALARIQATYDSHSSLDADSKDSSPRVSPVGHLGDAVGMALAWPQVVTPGFLTSLRAKRPESLLVLAHFAVIMHWCRGHWIVGRVGSRLLRSIVAALGPGWERWLQYPRDLVESTAPEPSVAVDQPT